MITDLMRHSTKAGRRELVLELAAIVATAVLQGVAFILLVPLLRALFVGDLGAAFAWLGSMAGVGVLYVVAFWYATQLGQRVSSSLLAALLQTLGDRLVELPVAWFGEDRSGLIADIATRGARFVSSTPYAVIRLILTGFITPATVLVGMCFFDWRLAVAMLVTLPIMWLTYRWLRATMERDDAKHAEAVADASSRVIEFARLQPTLRTAGDDSVSERLVREALGRQHSANRRMLITGGSAIATFSGVVQLALTVVIVVGAHLALGGSLEPATFIALLVLGVRFTEPISNSGALGGGISVANTTLAQLEALAQVERLPEPAASKAPADWGVSVRDVTFGYGGPAVLDGLSFEAPARSMTAIVGPSGSGKTTITKLIARFYDPEAGEVRIGGVTLQQLGTDAVEAAVAPVFQDVYLFDDSIIGNVWIGNPSLSRDQVLAAAALARVDEIAARLPDGWDARVGEAGANLSGGERQRVSIARALLKDAPIVLLDEATAALDIGNENAIGEALEAIRADRTIIVVAHRLQTIMTADHIVMLDGVGGVAESGTHDQLVAAGGPYSRYWSERVAASGWRLG